jgi:hypothetical protein
MRLYVTGIEPGPPDLWPWSKFQKLETDKGYHEPLGGDAFQTIVNKHPIAIYPQVTKQE